MEEQQQQAAAAGTPATSGATPMTAPSPGTSGSMPPGQQYFGQQQQQQQPQGAVPPPRPPPGDGAAPPTPTPPSAPPPTPPSAPPPSAPPPAAASAASAAASGPAPPKQQGGGGSARFLPPGTAITSEPASIVSALKAMEGTVKDKMPERQAKDLIKKMTTLVGLLESQALGEALRGHIGAFCQGLANLDYAAAEAAQRETVQESLEFDGDKSWVPAVSRLVLFFKAQSTAGSSTVEKKPAPAPAAPAQPQQQQQAIFEGALTAAPIPATPTAPSPSNQSVDDAAGTPAMATSQQPQDQPSPSQRPYASPPVPSPSPSPVPPAPQQQAPAPPPPAPSTQQYTVPQVQQGVSASISQPAHGGGTAMGGAVPPGGWGRAPNNNDGNIVSNQPAGYGLGADGSGNNVRHRQQSAGASVHHNTVARSGSGEGRAAFHPQLPEKPRGVPARTVSSESEGSAVTNGNGGGLPQSPDLSVNPINRQKHVKGGGRIWMWLCEGEIESFEEYADGRPHVVLFTARRAVPKRFEQVASVFESRVIFGIVHVDEAAILKRFSVDESSAPKLVIQPQFKGDRSTVTHFDGEIEFASICSFVADGLHASLFGKAPHPSNYGKAVLNDTGILPEVSPFVHFSVLFFSTSRDLPSEVSWLAKVFQDVVAVSVVPPRNELIRNSFRVEANSPATVIAIHPKTLAPISTHVGDTSYASLSSWVSSLLGELSKTEERPVAGPASFGAVAHGAQVGGRKDGGAQGHARIGGAAAASKQVAGAGSAGGQIRKPTRSLGSFAIRILMYATLFLGFVYGLYGAFELASANCAAAEHTASLPSPGEPILPLLEAQSLVRYEEMLKGAGIESTSDLWMLSEERIVGWELKPIQANKLRHIRDTYATGAGESSKGGAGRALPSYCPFVSSIRGYAAPIRGGLASALGEDAVSMIFSISAGETALGHAASSIRSGNHRYGEGEAPTPGGGLPFPARLLLSGVRGVLHVSVAAVGGVGDASWRALSSGVHSAWDAHFSIF